MIITQHSGGTVSSGDKHVGLKDVRRYQSHVHEYLASEDANLLLSGLESVHFFLITSRGDLIGWEECPLLGT